jgi:hypothetical protein
MTSPIDPIVIIIKDGEPTVERRRCPACAAQDRKRWKPPPTGNQQIDDMLQAAWEVGRRVGMEGDPYPRHGSPVCLGDVWRRAHGLPPTYEF